MNVHDRGELFNHRGDGTIRFFSKVGQKRGKENIASANSTKERYNERQNQERNEINDAASEFTGRRKGNK